MLQGQPQDHLLERMIPPGGSAGQQERQMVLGSHPRGKSSVTRDWRSLCDTVNALMPLNCALENGYKGKFYVTCISPLTDTKHIVPLKKRRSYEASILLLLLLLMFGGSLSEN